MNFDVLSHAVAESDSSQVQDLLQSVATAHELSSDQDKREQVMLDALTTYYDATLEYYFHLEQQEKKPDANPTESLDKLKIKRKSAMACLKLLVAYSFERPAYFNIYQHCKYSRFSTSSGYCACANSRIYKLSDVVIQTLQMFETSQHINDYLKLMQKNEKINEVLTEYKSYIAGYKIYLDKVHKAIRTKTALLLLLNTTGNKIYFQAVQDWGMHRVILFPALAECACRGFDRTESNDRAEIEAQVLTHANQIGKNKRQPLVYLSLGAGELLQDFLQVARLINEGHSLEIHLIEPNEISPIELRQFNLLRFAAEEVGLEFNVSIHASIQDFMRHNPGKKLHIATAVDFANIFKKECFRDVMQTQALLAKDGRFFFSFDEFRLEFSKTALEYTQVTSRSRTLESDIAPVGPILQANINPTQNKIRYACLSKALKFDDWIKVIPSLRELRCQKITISMLPVHIKGYFDNDTSETNHHFDAETLTQFFQLVLPNKQVSIRLFDTQEALLEIAHDVVTSLGLAFESMSHITSYIQQVRRMQPTAQHYYNCNYIDTDNQHKFHIGCENPRSMPSRLLVDHYKQMLGDSRYTSARKALEKTRRLDKARADEADAMLKRYDRTPWWSKIARCIVP